MANLVQPRYIIPVHGEYRHKALWAKLGAQLGFEVVKVENGDVLEVSETAAKIAQHVAAGVVIVDGTGLTDLGDEVLRDRWHLSQDGIFVIVCTLDESTGRLIAGPDCISRGAILTGEEEHVYDEARDQVLTYLERLPEDHGHDWNAVQQDLRRIVNRILRAKTGRKPMVVPLVMHV